MLKFVPFLVLLLVNISSAQNWVKIDSVFAPSGVLVRAFSAPAFGDLDGDGDYDLMLGSLSGRTAYYQNVGSADSAKFEKDTSFMNQIYPESDIEVNSTYPCFVDLDMDEDLDLVIGGYNGIIFYENIGDKNNPDFEKYTSVFDSVNTQIGTDAKPEFADIDNDGDPDLIIGAGETMYGPGPVSGVTLGFRNKSEEGTITFESDNSFVNNIPDVGYNSYPSLEDIDSDGDLDMLQGRDGGALYYYENSGNAEAPVWTRNYTVVNTVETTNYWKNPDFCDLDSDGDFDLIYGTDDGDIIFYRNDGNSSSPKFVRDKSYFKVLKVNATSTASLGDFDGDEDLDLISGTYYDGFVFFENTGSKLKPSFEKKTTAFTSIDPGNGTTPFFIDFDSDGDLDIVSGKTTGTVHLYLNNGTSFSVDNEIFNDVKVAYRSVPVLEDIDSDGDLDLLVGSDDRGDTKFYLNEGENNFVLNTEVFSGISFPRSCVPSFADLDYDGDMDLVLGESSGELICYENTGTINSPEWTLNEQLIAGVEVDQNSHPAFADLNGDGTLDIIIGEYDGNFSYFKNISDPVGILDKEVSVKDYNLLQNYPNPFNPSTKISFSLPESGEVSLKVYNSLGEEITTLINSYKEKGFYEVNFEAADLPSGIYIYSLQVNDFNQSRKMMLIK